MKTLTYGYDRMLRAGQILNALEVHGVNQARLLAELGNILDSGKTGEIYGKEGDDNGVQPKEV